MQKKLAKAFACCACCAWGEGSCLCVLPVLLSSLSAASAWHTAAGCAAKGGRGREINPENHVGREQGIREGAAAAPQY